MGKNGNQMLHDQSNLLFTVCDKNRTTYMIKKHVNFYDVVDRANLVFTIIKKIVNIIFLKHEVNIIFFIYVINCLFIKN